MDIVTVLITFTWLNSILSYNLDVVYPIVTSNPNDNDPTSHFGQSVKLTREPSSLDTDGSLSSAYVIVGAPFASSVTSTWKDISKPGHLYKCSLNPKHPRTTSHCKPYAIAVNQTTANNHNDGFQDMLFGSTIELQKPNSGKMLVCGPRYYNDFRILPVLGVCFSQDYNVGENAHFNKVSFTPAHFELVQSYSTNKKEQFDFYITGYSQMGFSAHFLYNTDEVVLGVPGANLWRGTLALYKHNKTYNLGYKGVKGVSTFSYLGYSVSSGNFRNLLETLYVTGAPRSNNDSGIVVFITREILESKLNVGTQISSDRVLQKLQGDQVGDYFGATLLVVNLNGDKYDDLLVGAPMASSKQGKSYDEGKVYVYFGSGQTSSFMTKGEVLTGNSAPKGRFGTSIAALGDIDMDGFPDVAIAAPFEEGGGSVYIYHGRATGITLSYSQQIKAETFQPYIKGLKGFGFGLGAADIDNNGYTDLTIGAYLSGHVITLRSSPVITFNVSLESRPPAITAKPGSEFKIEACVKYIVPASNTNDVCARLTLMTEVNYLPPPRIQLSKEGAQIGMAHIQDLVLKQNVTTCLNFSGKVVDRSSQFDHKTDVRFRMTVELRQSKSKNSSTCQRLPKLKAGENALILKKEQAGTSTGSTPEFCKTCPVVAPDKPSSVDLVVPFVLGCGDDNKCECDLAVKASFQNSPLSKFILGETKTVDYSVVMTNAGEPATSSVLHIMWRGKIGVTVFSKPGGCDFTNDVMMPHLRCELRNIIRNDTTEQVKVLFDVSRLLEPTFNVEAHVTTQSFDVNPNNNEDTVALQFAMSADIQVEGILKNTLLERYDKDNAGSRVNFIQTYKITKHGPSPVGQVNITVQIPRGIVLRQKVEGLDRNTVKTIDGADSTLCSLLRTTDTIIQPELPNPPELSPSDPDTPGILEYDSSDNEQDPSSSSLGGPGISDYDTVGGDKETPSEGGQHERRKRQTEDEASARTTSELIFLFDCNSNQISTTCDEYLCTLGPILEEKSYLLMIEGAFLPHPVAPILRDKELVVIKTHARAEIVSPAGIIQGYGNKPDRPDSDFNTSFTYAVVLALPFWVIPLAIILGILLLILLALLLYKVGFFKRKQIPTPENERKPLTEEERTEMNNKEPEQTPPQ